FTTTQRLLLEDQDEPAPPIPGQDDWSQNDLYEYDFNAPGQKLRLVTGSADPEGAGLVANGLFLVSEDGAYAYFLARGRALTGPNARDASPEPGDHNLYVYHRAAAQAGGTTTFIGALASINESLIQVSAAGRYALFRSTADLAGERSAGDLHSDVYRYDAAEDELLRVWTNDPAHNGTARADGASLERTTNSVSGVPSAASSRGSTGGWNSFLQVSDDGSLVGFTTAEPLSRDDRNAESDAYLWEAATGRMTLLTAGTSKPGNQFAGSSFTGMTPSGDSLFVRSASPLVKEHTSGQNAAYVIRRDGGFSEPAVPPEICVGDDCQRAETSMPGPFAGAGSSTFAGAGNVVLPSGAPKTEKRSKVRVRKVKTVRGSRTRVRVSVPGKGKIRVSGSGLARASKSAKKAGTYRVTVKLSQRAKRTLRRKDRVKVRVRVRFRPVEGKSSVVRRSVTFRTAKKKTRSSKSSSRSVRRVSVLSSDVQKGR
ncbi:MAG: hypothetical protein M3Y23_05910, partial [Actinomycetota bacterium]|nr:hypothetical protein [Actinomycetota bacterium]